MLMQHALVEVVALSSWVEELASPQPHCRPSGEPFQYLAHFLRQNVMALLLIAFGGDQARGTWRQVLKIIPHVRATKELAVHGCAVTRSPDFWRFSSAMLAKARVSLARSSVRLPGVERRKATYACTQRTSS